MKRLWMSKSRATIALAAILALSAVSAVRLSGIGLAQDTPPPKEQVEKNVEEKAEGRGESAEKGPEKSEEKSEEKSPKRGEREKEPVKGEEKSEEKAPVKGEEEKGEEKAPVKEERKVPRKTEGKEPVEGEEKGPMKEEGDVPRKGEGKDPEGRPVPRKGDPEMSKDPMPGRGRPIPGKEVKEPGEGQRPVPGKEAPKGSVFEGQFVAIAGNRLTMTVKEGKERAFQVLEDARLTLDGKAFRAADLKPGMTLRVTTLEDQGAAIHVEVLDPNAGPAAKMRLPKEGTPLPKPQPNEEKSPRKVMPKEGAEVERVVTKGMREDFCECLNPNAANNWIFGNRARINFGGAPNFTTVTPSLAPTPFSTMEGCSTISDANGDLLFYTDGTTVWDKNGLPMPNGNGLMGNSTSTQSALIVPCSCDRYFIFTTDGYEPHYANGLRYSVVDMTQNLPLGDVVTKNTLLLANSSEKVAGVGDGSGGFWVVAHSMDDNSFYAYHILPDGTCTPQPPAISAVGINYGGVNSRYGQGQMKISPDGTLLAHAGLSLTASPPSFIELFKFNTGNGSVSNYSGGAVTSRDTSPNRFYGLEFSPDSKSLWATTTQTTSVIYHYPIGVNGLEPSTPIPSDQSGPSAVAGLQLGPDEKIYIARINQPGNPSSLYVLPNPNAVGGGWVSATDPTNLLPLTTGSNSQYGLPAVVAGNFTCGGTEITKGEIVYDGRTSTTCGKGQICFYLKLPTMKDKEGNVITATGVIHLTLYQNGHPVVSLPASPVLNDKEGARYCFPIDPANIRRLDCERLGGFDFVATAEFSFNMATTLNTSATFGTAPTGMIADVNNDYRCQCPEDPKPVACGCCPGENLVKNGDFQHPGENHSEYELASELGLLYPGTYSVNNVESIGKACRHWTLPKACDGTKNFSDNVLIVNGQTNQPAGSTSVIWEQQIVLKSNPNGKEPGYRLCFRYLPLPQCCFDVPAKPYVLVNGGRIPLTDVCDEDTGCGHIYAATFHGGGTINLQIVLPEDGKGDGNDLLIDNISMVRIEKVDPSYLAFALDDQAPNGGTYNCVVTAPTILAAPYTWTWELYDVNDVLVVPNQIFSGGSTQTFANLPIETEFWVKLKVKSDCHEWTARKRPSGILTTRKAKAGLTDEPNAEPAKTEKGPLTPKRERAE